MKSVTQKYDYYILFAMGISKLLRTLSKIDFGIFSIRIIDELWHVWTDFMGKKLGNVEFPPSLLLTHKFYSHVTHIGDKILVFNFGFSHVFSFIEHSFKQFQVTHAT